MGVLLRYLLAGVTGVVVAMVVLVAVEALGHLAYPPPPGLDAADPATRQALQDYFSQLPPAAFLFVLAALVLGALAGACTAAWIARERPMLLALLVGALMLAAAIANMVMIPHPAWFVVLAVLAVPAAALLGGLLGQRLRRPRPGSARAPAAS